MIKRILLLLLALAVTGAAVVALIYANREMRKEREADGNEETPVVGASLVHQTTNGQVAVKMEAELRRRMGVQTGALTTTNLPKEVRAFGRVIDPSSLAGFAGEIKAAEIALETSRKEYARLKKLYDQNQNASLRSVEVAEAEVRQHQLSIQTAKDRLALAWGPKMAAQPDLAAFLQSFVEWKKALVQLELLPAQTLKSPPPTIRVALAADERLSVPASYFGPPPAVNTAAPVQSFLYLVQNTQWAPGTRVAGFLPPGEEFRGILMPHAAIVRAGGQTWAYRQTADDAFVREPVDLGPPVPEGWLTTRGWKAGDRVVIRGAQVLLSEELKAQIKLVD